MALTFTKEVRIITQCEGKAHYNDRLPTALRQAQNNVGTEGHVATMSEFLQARTSAPFDNELWTTWYTANTAEYVGKTPGGKSVVVIAHGVGPFTSPERIEGAYREGLLNGAGRITPSEFGQLLASQTPSLSYDEFTKTTSPPSSYAVIMDFATAKRTVSDHQPINHLRKNPLVIARGGGEAAANAFLDKAAQKYAKYGQWHPFNNVDIDQPRGRVLFLGNNDGNGLNCGHLSQQLRPLRRGSAGGAGARASLPDDGCTVT